MSGTSRLLEFTTGLSLSVRGEDGGVSLCRYDGDDGADGCIV